MAAARVQPGNVSGNFRPVVMKTFRVPLKLGLNLPGMEICTPQSWAKGRPLALQAVADSEIARDYLQSCHDHGIGIHHQVPSSIAGMIAAAGPIPGPACGHESESYEPQAEFHRDSDGRQRRPIRVAGREREPVTTLLPSVDGIASCRIRVRPGADSNQRVRVGREFGPASGGHPMLPVTVTVASVQTRLPILF
jgi:hypothetical protein